MAFRLPFRGRERQDMMTSMKLRIGVPIFLLAGLLACKHSDTTTAPGAIASVAIDSPSTVQSGQSFTIDVSAVNVGINNVHNGRVEVTLPAPRGLI